MENEDNNLIKNGDVEHAADVEEIDVKIAPAGSKDKEEKPQLVPFGKLFRFSDKFDVFLMIIGTLGSIAYGAVIPCQFILFGEVTDSFVEFIQCTTNPVNCTSTPDVEGAVTFIAYLYVAFAFGNLVLAWLCIGIWGWTAERQVHKMRKVLFRNIINQEIAWFDTHSSGEISARLAEDLNKVADAIGGKFGRLISCLFTFVAGYVLGFVYSWRMTLVMMILLPMVMISGGIVAKVTGGFTSKETAAYAKAGGVAEQSISCIKTVAAFGGEEMQVKKYDEHLGLACHFGIKKGFSVGLGFGVFQLVLFINYAISFWYGIKLIRDGRVSPGDVITVFFAVFIASMTLGQAGPSGQALAAARGAAFELFKMMEKKSEIDPSSKEGAKPETIEGNVEFKDINFYYPSRDTVQVLKDFNLKVPSGKRVALVGESGCGKSTVVKLIQRFYDPIGGTVLVDGEDIKSLNVRHLRNFIGVVNQEPVLFATTIAENIAYGREGVTQQEIEDAAKMANAHNFISQFPQGYETLCGERGAQMSGGQKQRIAIARALVRNPKILLLDEATSALDTESEAVVQEALDKAGEGRTTVIIAHRLSTIKNSDVIVAVKEGGVVESGTHDELLALDGLYKKLVETQKVEDEEEKIEDEEDDDDDEKDEQGNEVNEANENETNEKTSLFGSSRKLDAGKPGYSMESLASAVTVSEIGVTPKEAPIKFTRLLKMNSPEWRSLLVGSLGSIIYGAYPFLFALCLGGLFKTFSYNPKNDAESQKLKDDAKWWAMVWVLIGVESGIGVLLQNWMFARSGEALTRRLRKEAFSSFLRQDVGFFDKEENATGTICARLATEVSSIQGATGAQVGLIISGSITMVGCIIVALLSSWKIALISFAFIPILFFGGKLSTYALGSKTRTDENEDPGKVVEETLSNIHTVTSFSLQNSFYERYCRSTAQQYSKDKRRAHLAGISTGTIMCIVNLSWGASFRYGGKLLADDEIGINRMITTIFTVVMGAVTLGQVYSMTPDYTKAKEAARKLFHLLDRVPSIDSYSDKGIRLESCDGSVELTNVRFKYPTRRKVRVLRNLNLSAKPGQIIALVGTSGCGKSTTVSLVERFYDANKGKVKLDGHEIKSLNVKWLRSKIGLVSQEPVLFNMTIKENIAYGDTTREVTDKEIEEAAKMANIHDFISNLPNGYDTDVGDKGTLISGGQKQRIAIARALIRDPKILLLDEATSALDTESEKIVQQALDKASVGRTTLVIAHRLSTIQNADVIVVIRRGKVVEEGTHQELLALKGEYYALYKAQASHDGTE